MASGEVYHDGTEEDGEKRCYGRESTRRIPARRADPRRWDCDATGKRNKCLLLESAIVARWLVSRLVPLLGWTSPRTIQFLIFSSAGLESHVSTVECLIDP